MLTYNMLRRWTISGMQSDLTEKNETKANHWRKHLCIARSTLYTNIACAIRTRRRFRPLPKAGFSDCCWRHRTERPRNWLNGERCGNAFGALLPMLAALFGE